VATSKVEEQKCTRCGNIKKLNATNFYKSYSELFKNNGDSRMCICKDCVIELAEQFKKRFNSDTRGLYEICKLLDVYYEKSLYDSAVEQASKNNGNPFSVYFQKANSLPQYRGKTFIDSELFDKKQDDEEIAEDIGHDIVDFWGDGFSQSDYNFLEKEFENLTARYECDSYAQEILFKEIAFQTLDIRNKRKDGKDVSKEVKTLQDLLGSANIKPAQENASMASEQVTFGTLIKKYENEKPVPEPLPEWMTADWIRKYVVVWFFGNLCRMMGKVNPFKDEYDEEINKYTVKVDEDEERDE
jgi:hypothetical protein